LHLVSDEKQRIGKKAASLIHPGDYVILDTSTTVQACAEHLEDIDVTIITSSINQADILSKNKQAHIHLLGGLLQKEHRYVYGTAVLDKLSEYYVDRTFIGVIGISEAGLTVAHEEDGVVMKKMMQQAKQVVLLADHTKIGVTGYYRFGTLDDIDLFITDREPDKEFQKLLEKSQVEMIIA